MNQTAWELSELMPEFETAAYTQRLEDIQKRLETFLMTYKTLNDDMSVDSFVQMMREKEQIQFSVFLVNLHAYLKNSQDTQNEIVKKHLRQADELSTHVANSLRYLHLWYIALPKEKAYAFAKGMGEDSYVFYKKYDLGKYSLSASEEKIISLKDMNGSDFLQSLYDGICSKFSFDFDGKKQSLTQMRKYLTDDSREKRRDAASAIQQKFSDNMHILGDMYQAVIKDHIIEAVNIRGYESTLQVRTLSEDISQKAVLSLFDAAKGANHIFQKFFKLKQKVLGYDTLELYDTYAPIRLTEKEKVPYEKAMNTILSAAERIDSSFSQKIRDLVKDGHVDSVFSEHKRGGAFNYGVGNGVKPFVFMQYLEEEDDMFTLAHEFGHAIHSSMSVDKSLYSSHSSIGIAESASTFMEEMVMDEILQTASNRKKIELLFQQILSAYQTIQRQIYISIFEQQAHEKISNGTTNSELHSIWTDLQKEQFADSVHIPNTLQSWSYIPHIYHTPFYCYNYGVGLILAMLLYEKRTENPDTFAELYKKYLRISGSAGTVETAKEMGIDLEDANTWKKGFDVIAQKVSVLESLCKEEGLM
ncbi:MAG: M3 family metallopeptidase [Candidatus Woesearchaeota archaeon]